MPPSKKKLAATPQPSTRSTSAVLNFFLGACAMYYIWIAGIAPGDFQGDSWEYLGLAGQMKAGLFGLSSYRYLRGLFYPWFLSVTWGHEGSLTYFLQVAVFLASLYLALRILGFGSVYCLLPVCAAMIPAFAFLQKLVYPDGLLVSFTLLFFVALAKRRWRICGALGALLLLTKLVFAVVLPIGLVVFLFERGTIRPKMLGRGLVLLLLLAPIGAFVLLDYIFVDLGYMVTFARPYAHGSPIESVFPGDQLTFTCGSRPYTVSRSDLFYEPVTVPYSIAAFGPLREAQASALGCTKGDLRSLKQDLIRAALLRNPLRHLALGLETFLRTIVGSYDSNHVSYILQLREISWRTNYDIRSYFEPYEITLQPQYRNNGFNIVQGPSMLFLVNYLFLMGGQALVSLIALCGLVLGAIFAYRRTRLLDCIMDPVNVALTLFLVVYSLLVSVSVPLILDRYTFINLLLLCILTVRVARKAFELPDSK